MNVSHVAEYRFYDLPPEKAQAIDRLLTKTLLEHGYQYTRDYDMVFRPTHEKVEWENKQTPDDKPSPAQTSFARKLYKDLSALVQKHSNEQEAATVVNLLETVRTGMRDPEVTRKQASEFIGAMKDAIDELTFKQKGVRTNEWG